MASLQIHDIKFQFLPLWKPFSLEPRRLPYLNFPPRQFSRKVRVVFACPENNRKKNARGRFNSVCCFCSKTKDAEIDEVEVEERNENERPPFDINLAVVLAGFAFEAYTSPPVMNSSSYRVYT